MFSIFDFPKTCQLEGVFEVIPKEIMQIGKSRTFEELQTIKETKNEDSRGLRKLTNGGNFVPKF